MKYLKLFENFKDGDSLKKVYLAFREDSGQRWWTYKGFAGDKFFVQIHENNIDKIDVNPDYPILTYHTDTVNYHLHLFQVSYRSSAFAAKKILILHTSIHCKTFNIFLFFYVFQIFSL